MCLDDPAMDAHPGLAVMGYMRSILGEENDELLTISAKFSLKDGERLAKMKELDAWLDPMESDTPKAGRCGVCLMIQ